MSVVARGAEAVAVLLEGRAAELPVALEAASVVEQPEGVLAGLEAAPMPAAPRSLMVAPTLAKGTRVRAGCCRSRGVPQRCTATSAERCC